MKFKNLKELMAKFTDETVCREYMEKIYFPKGKPVCPFCQYDEKIWRIEGGKRYKCKQCLKKFSITVGTIYENSNIPMSTWFGAMYLVTSHKKGISSIQLGKDLGVTQKTAWFMLHRIREMLKDKSPDRLKNTIEVDESFIGGKEKNKHKSKRTETTGRVNIKTPVLGIVEREGKVHVEKLQSVSIEEMYPIIESKIEQGAQVVTDDAPAYNRLEMKFNHFVINHSEGVYAKGKIHTNTIEGFWSHLKRGIIGIYHQVSYKHLNKYCGEFAFRYNTRKLSEATRFDLSLAQSVGRRLKYARLTSKNYVE
jgi:transposase-like protein